MILRTALFLLLLGQAGGTVIPANQLCVESVFEMYGSLTFAGPADYYVAACQGPLKVASMYAASRRYCPADELAPGIEYWKEKLCRRYGKTGLLPESAVAQNLTAAAVAAMPVVDIGEVPETEVLNRTVMISQAWFDAGHRTAYVWNLETWAHETYGFAMYGFWGIVLLVGVVHNVWSSLLHAKLARWTGDVEDRERKPEGVRWLSTAYDRVKTHAIVPSALGSYRRRLFLWCTVPTRLESLVIGAFYVVNVALCCVRYEAFLENTYYPGDTASQICRYICDRTGIIAYAQLSWLWIFAGRNNIFQWATGWHFSTFNLFHRHVARVATIEAIAHSAAYTVFYYLGDPTGANFKTDFKATWFWTGVLATIAMSLILFFSAAWFRVHAYETFLLIHIGFALMTIVGLFYHTSIFEGEYDPYLWAPVAIWVFDRAARLVRIAWWAVRKKRAVAEVSYDAGADLLVARLPLSHVFRPAAGQHYYLYQPLRWWGGWENHPFTLASWDADALEFWLRPANGWTRRLRDAAARGKGISTPLLLEGPYGHHLPLHAFDKVLLLAGGAGITAAAAYLAEHHERHESGGPTRTRDVRLVWADRSGEVAMRGMMSRSRLAAALARPEVRADFYVTGEQKEKGDETGVFRGRPDIAGLVEEAAREGWERGWRVAVFVCGPDGMSDAARAAAAASMRRYEKTVEYFEEAFGW